MRLWIVTCSEWLTTFCYWLVSWSQTDQISVTEPHWSFQIMHFYVGDFWPRSVLWKKLMNAARMMIIEDLIVVAFRAEAPRRWCAPVESTISQQTRKEYTVVLKPYYRSLNLPSPPERHWRHCENSYPSLEWNHSHHETIPRLVNVLEDRTIPWYHFWVRRVDKPKKRPKKRSSDQL